MQLAFVSTRGEEPALAGALGMNATVTGHGMATLFETAANAVRVATARRRARSEILHGELGTDGPDALARVIEGEIIPRLLLAHREGESAHNSVPALVSGTIPEGYAERFAAETLREEAMALLVRVDALLTRGVSIETLYLNLLAPAARQLGIWWESDACDFVDVTMGLWRLQEIVHELAARRPGRGPLPGVDRRALFAPVPGDQHGFGTLLVEEFFRRAGWTTWNASPTANSKLIALTAGRSFELIGLTATCERHIEELSGIIRAIRATSRNPGIAVMVGGRLFSECPELAVEVGADGTAADGLNAVAVAEKLVAARECRAATDLPR